MDAKKVNGSGNGTNSAARFYLPSGVTFDTNGNVYVADTGNNTIRKLTPAGTNWVASTIAGTALSSGRTDGTNNAARFNNPSGVLMDTAGNLVVADYYNSTIRKVAPSGTNPSSATAWSTCVQLGIPWRSSGARSPSRCSLP